MRILWVCDVVPNKYGGFERTCVYVARAAVRSGAKCTFLFSGEACTQLAEELTELDARLLTWTPQKLKLGKSRWLHKFVTDGGFDIVHLHFLPVLSLFSFLMRNSTTRLFFSYRLSGAPAESSIAKTLYKKIRYLLLGQGIEKVFCVSGYAREKLIADFQIPENKSVVLYNGINVSEIKEKIPQFPAGEAWQPKLVCVASLIPEKGVDYLIEAFAEYIGHFPDAVLDIVGDGPHRAALEQQVKQSRLENNVHFTGRNENVLEILPNYHIAVVPSIWQEAFGFTVIEAMVCGCAVIASRVGGIPEIIEDGVSGLLVAPENAGEIFQKLVFLSEDTDRVVRMAEAARKRVECIFNLENTADTQVKHYLSVYGTMLDRQNQVTPKTLVRNSIASISRLAPARALTRIFAGNYASIMMIHRFSEFSPSIQADNSAVFMREMLEEVRKLKIPVVSVDQIIEAKLGLSDIPPNAVAFSMDDGFIDQATIGAELFLEYDCPVTIFVVTDYLDDKYWMLDSKLEYILYHSPLDVITVESSSGVKTYPRGSSEDISSTIRSIMEYARSLPLRDAVPFMDALALAGEVDLPEKAPAEYRPMSWEDSRNLESRGVMIGSQTCRHPVLSSEDDETAKYEIEHSFCRLGEELKTPSKVFCYPTGRYQDYLSRDMEYLRQAGYTGALNAEPGYVDVSGHNNGSIYSINRFALPNDINAFRQYALHAELMKEKIRFW